MDSLHAIGFYVSAAISLGGGLLAAFLPGRGLRGGALAIAGVGTAGLYASLSAGFSGAVALVCFVGCAALLGAPHYRAVDSATGARWRQAGAVSAGALFAMLAFAAWRGDFAQARFYGGELGTAAIGRLLFAHDALATEAVGALVLVALAGASAVWRMTGRVR